jgi:hypothetical protein
MRLPHRGHTRRSLEGLLPTLANPRPRRDRQVLATLRAVILRHHTVLEHLADLGLPSLARPCAFRACEGRVAELGVAAKYRSHQAPLSLWDWGRACGFQGPNSAVLRRMVVSIAAVADLWDLRLRAFMV